MLFLLREITISSNTSMLYVLSKEQKEQVCDATKADQGTKVGNKINYQAIQRTYENQNEYST